ncbi:endolytic transglycosylase MltG [Granulosicoccaceae sp. 1_MG-2023]|nr:endolytic transglycosylase MltG [Granulosicoccaceae sp. 1_MG-2023]
MIKRLLLVVILLVGAAAAFVWFQYQHFLSSSLEFDPPERVFTLEKGWSAKRLGQALQGEGILQSTVWFDVYMRLSGQSAALQAGEYALESGLTPVALVSLFTRGEVTRYNFTIIEGWTYRQLREVMAANEVLVQTLTDMDDEAIMRAIGKPGVHPEGQFLPDTYHFPKGMTDLDLLQKASDALDAALDQAWQDRQQDIPLKSPYEALILASIIEKETGVAAERPQIAGVFTRRLQKGMRLQTDPTVIYGMGERFDGNIRRKDLRTDTPYNTYTRKGLPPTPIALAGADALHAAVHPLDGDALFFVSRGDGTHVFSATVKEHNAAVRKYQLKR